MTRSFLFSAESGTRNPASASRPSSTTTTLPCPTSSSPPTASTSSPPLSTPRSNCGTTPSASRSRRTRATRTRSTASLPTSPSPEASGSSAARRTTWCTFGICRLRRSFRSSPDTRTSSSAPRATPRRTSSRQLRSRTTKRSSCGRVTTDLRVLFRTALSVLISKLVIFLYHSFREMWFSCLLV